MKLITMKNNVIPKKIRYNKNQKDIKAEERYDWGRIYWY